MRLVLLILILNIQYVFAQSLSKSFTYLYEGQYDLAATSLHEILKYHHDNPAAQYGFAKLYSMKDYKQYNLDSANYFALKCSEGLKKEWPKGDQKKFLKVGFREYNVSELQKRINNEAYRVADSINQAAEWNHFISVFTSSPMISTAIEKRNQAAFNEALQKNDYKSFEDFLEKYPDAKQVNQARELYEDHLYKTKTKDSTWLSYKLFIDAYPKSPYYTRAKANYERLLFIDKTKMHRVNDYVTFAQEFPDNSYAQAAEDSVFSIVTRDDQLSSYLNFIQAYPSNRNVNAAWQKVFEDQGSVVFVRR